MAYETILRDCSMDQFRRTFLSKAEFRRRIGEMSVKEMLFDRKATNALEENLRLHITSNALIQVGEGSLCVTSYVIKDHGSSCVVYLSYGGGRLRLTAEGRDGDSGYFLVASSAAEGVKLRIESKSDHYKFRTWAVNAIVIVLGLAFGVIPGILIAVFLLFAAPRIYRKKIEKLIFPALETTFGRVQ